MKKLDFESVIRTVKNINKFIFETYPESKVKLRLCVSPQYFSKMFHSKRNVALLSNNEKSRIGTICLYSVLRAKRMNKIMLVVKDFSYFKYYYEYIDKIEEALHLSEQCKQYLKVVPSHVLNSHIKKASSFLQRIDEVVIDDGQLIFENNDKLSVIVNNIVSGGYKIVISGSNNDSNPLFSNLIHNEEIVNDSKFIIVDNTPEYDFLHNWFITDRKTVTPIFEIAVMMEEKKLNMIDFFSTMSMNFPIDFNKLKKFDIRFIKDRIPEKFFKKIN